MSLLRAGDMQSAVIASGLAVAFFTASVEDAEARPRHARRTPQTAEQVQQSEAQPSSGGGFLSIFQSRAGETAAPSSNSTTLFYHVRSHRLEFNGTVYNAGSGNREGYNNPDYQRVNNRGPIPEGGFPLNPRESFFHGYKAWRVGNPPGRSGILIHPDSIRLFENKKLKTYRPVGESNGCIAVNSAQYAEFVTAMERLRPTRIVVSPQ